MIKGDFQLRIKKMVKIPLWVQHQVKRKQKRKEKEMMKESTYNSESLCVIKVPIILIFIIKSIKACSL